METLISQAAAEFNISPNKAEQTIKLFEDGATIPFVARYRKEVTGSLDEVQLGKLVQLKERHERLEKRKKYILKSLGEQEVLTEKLQQQIEETREESELEDIWLPYKPKRKTRAVKAREAGLEGLANIIMAGHERDLQGRCAKFLNDKVPDEETALSGARDIIAERMNENTAVRQRIRDYFERYGKIFARRTKKEDDGEGHLFEKFDNSHHPLKRIPAHRFLALKRGEERGYLRLNIQPDEEHVLSFLERFFIKDHAPDCAAQLQLAAKDAYKRLLQPSLENEFAAKTKERADEEAISIFAVNLEQLLLSPPVGEKRVLALDPGFRTGCKVVCLDEHGKLLHNETIYPHPPQNEQGKAKSKINTLVNSFKIEAVAIGNGTAGRETEQLVKHIRFERDVEVFVVDESGASVYSASSIARAEFPDYDVTVRGAVSIGRRLQDPLAELVKIDPKSIGVGQYQHDVDQTKLRNSLEQTVVNTVNKVGVNVNTASEHLLKYVAGLGPSSAKEIITVRTESGGIASRAELKKVPKIGPKAFAQCAGFLRIRDAKNPLDNTGVHPERYALVGKMAKDCGLGIKELAGNREKLEAVDLNKYVSKEVGLPTLRDIIAELKKPGRDLRKKAKAFSFSNRLRSIEDVEEGMILPAMVVNLTDFGAFVDLGIKENGLLHKSQIAEEFVKNPAEKLRLHQELEVKVVNVDKERKRIGVTLRY